MPVCEAQVELGVEAFLEEAAMPVEPRAVERAWETGLTNLYRKDDCFVGDVTGESRSRSAADEALRG